ncbi:MAG: helix-turn-helix domain-containing protein [Mycobacterium sp.]|jgi:excisionase family DNA binding protein|nr:helix-turn-helix domain-containing protein [Mycobacterium sp.]
MTTVTIAEPDAILTTDGAAAEMEVCPETVLRLIRSGKLRAAKVSRGYRIKRSWIYAYLDEAS